MVLLFIMERWANGARMPRLNGMPLVRHHTTQTTSHSVYTTPQISTSTLAVQEKFISLRAVRNYMLLFNHKKRIITCKLESKYGCTFHGNHLTFSNL
jgi:hypothetical protein